MDETNPALAAIKKALPGLSDMQVLGAVCATLMRERLEERRYTAEAGRDTRAKIRASWMIHGMREATDQLLGVLMPELDRRGLVP